MDLLIHFDESGFQNTKNAFEQKAAIVQNVISVYDSLGLPKLEKRELVLMFQKPEELVFDKMTGGQDVSIAGLKVDKLKAMDILKKPDSYDSFLLAVKEALLQLSIQESPFERSVTITTIEHYFQLNDAGKVELTQAGLSGIERGYKRFASTDKAKKMYQLANGIIEKCKELEALDIIMRNPNGIVGVFKEILQGGDGKPLQIRVQGILNMNQ